MTMSVGSYGYSSRPYCTSLAFVKMAEDGLKFYGKVRHLLDVGMKKLQAENVRTSLILIKEHQFYL